jgi:hypothetical protein
MQWLHRRSKGSPRPWDGRRSTDSPKHQVPPTERSVAPVTRIAKTAGNLIAVLVWLLVGLAVVAIGLNNFWDAFEVSAGHGTGGTWVATQYRCTSDADCSWYGTFNPSDPQSTSLVDVPLGGGSARQAGDTLNAVVITDMGGPQAFWIGAGMTGTTLWGLGALLLAATWFGLPWIVKLIQGRRAGAGPSAAQDAPPKDRHAANLENRLADDS